jgi:iron-sulfur cluster repair protein YtfE (RIC family)
MKRHPALQPFSRDHNVGLVLARRLSTSPDWQAALDEFVNLWNTELQEHFQEEEELLLPLSSDQERATLLGEHKAIGAYVAWARLGMLGPRDVSRLGQMLNDHIRWEERALFPAIEKRSSEDELRALAAQTLEVERRRSNSDWAPRRGELQGRQSHRA